MRGGKRKKQTSNDAPFNEIISQIGQINGKCIPCLIDFEGYSIYHCDTPLKPTKKHQNIFLATYFQKWQKYIELKSQRHYLDIFQLNQYDMHIISHFFTIWKAKYIQLSMANVIFYFTKWQLRFENIILRSFLISHVGRRAFFAWKLVIHRSKTVGRYQKWKIRKYFLIMKKLYEGSTRSTKEYQRKSLIITSFSTKKIYFKKWAIKAKNRRLLNIKEKFQTKRLELQLNHSFILWKKCYFVQLQTKRRLKSIQKNAFEFWKKSNDVKQNFLNKMNEIQTHHNQKVIKKVIKRWKRKYKIKRSKKRKVNVKLWSLVVYHKIIFDQIQQRNKFNIETKIFTYMKKQAKKSTTEIGKRMFNRWRRIAFLQTAEKSVSQNYLRIKYETSLIKWRMKLHEIIDERKINEIRKEVVEKNCILHCFKIWISKSMIIYRQKMKLVKKFRRRHLITFPFIAWKNIGLLKRLRAQQFLKQRLAKKYFPAFKLYVEYSLNKKYQKSIRLDYHRIKRKWFNVWKKALEQKGYHYNNNDDQLVVRLINRPNNFLFVSRLSYI